MTGETPHQEIENLWAAVNALQEKAAKVAEKQAETDKLWRLCEEVLVEFKALNGNFAIVTSKIGDCSLALQEIARVKTEYAKKMAQKETNGPKPAESGKVIALLGKSYAFRDDLKNLGASWQEVTDDQGKSVRAWCIPLGEFTLAKREKIEALGIPQLRIVEAKKP